MTIMTLGRLISSVPRLGKACSAILTVAVPGSGLKLMRLVSKQLSSAMLGVVQRYTLHLDGYSDLIQEIVLLRHTKLRHLQVVVRVHKINVQVQGRDPWGGHAMQLCSFVEEVSNAISSLTHLDIILPSSIGTSPEAMTNILSLLAPACPALQHLHVKGDICRSLLAVFGAACPKISSLTVMTTAPSDSLQELKLMLPSLAHYCCLPAHGNGLDSPDQVAGFQENANDVVDSGLNCLALQPGMCLTNMDFGPLTLTPEMWHALPQGLQQLRCSVSNRSSSPPTSLPPLQNLKQVELYCAGTLEIELGQLVSVLHVAPEVKNLILSSWVKGTSGSTENNADVLHACIGVLCMRDSIPQLALLNERILGGLAVTSHSDQQDSFPGLIVRSRDRGGQVEEDNISWFLDKLPPFPGFRKLELFYPLDAKHHTPSITEHIAAVFPNLTSLRITSYPVDEKDLAYLGACGKLQQLFLRGEDVSTLGLGALCSRLGLLEMVQLEVSSHSFPHVDRECGELRSMLQAYGSHMKIIVKAGLR